MRVPEAKVSLDHPVGKVIYALAAAQELAARAAFSAVRKGDDGEALHDLRVSLRRMRSLLSAYRHELQIQKSTRRKLANLAQVTNPARDAQIRLDLYAALPPSRQTRARIGYAWAGRQLHMEASEYAHVALVNTPAEFNRLLAQIRRELQGHCTGSDRLWRISLADKIQTAWRKLDRRLQKCGDKFEMPEAHRVRIAAKHLRYLVEPAAGLLQPCKPVVRETRELQTLLGNLHDTQIFTAWLLETAAATGANQAHRTLEDVLGEPSTSEERVPDVLPGLTYLAKMIDARKRRIEDQARSWCASGGNRRLATAVQTLLDAL